MIEITEEWRDIPDWEGFYQASNLGRIRSLSRVSSRGCRGGFMRIEGQILRQSKSSNGYLRMSFLDADGGRAKSVSAHRMIASAFHGLPPTPKHQVAHHDGDRTNNLPNNLRWATSSENIADKKRHGTFLFGELSHRSKLTEAQVLLIRKIGEEFSLGEIGEIFSMTKNNIRRILNRETWVHI